MLRTLTLTNLALLLFLTLFLLLLPSKASAEIECQIGISSGSVSWSGEILGDKPYTCARTCRYNLATVAVCFVNNGTCHGEFVSNGKHCLMSNGQIDPSDGLRFGGNTVIRDPSADPDKPWDPNAPSSMPAKVMNVIRGMPRDTTSGIQQAQAFKDIAHIEGMGVMTLDELLIKNSQLLDINKGYSSLMSTMSGQLYSIRNLSDYIEKNTAQTAAFSQMSANTLGNILNKLSDSGSGGGTGGGDSETYLKNISNAISNHFIGNSYSALAHLDNTVSRLDSVKRTLDDNYSSFTNYFAFRMDSLEKALSGIGGGGGDVDLSGGKSFIVLWPSSFLSFLQTMRVSLIPVTFRPICHSFKLVSQMIEAWPNTILRVASFTRSRSMRALCVIANTTGIFTCSRLIGGKLIRLSVPVQKSVISTKAVTLTFGRCVNLTSINTPRIRARPLFPRVKTQTSRRRKFRLMRSCFTSPHRRGTRRTAKG